MGENVLTKFNAKSNPLWINQTNGHKDFHVTDESRRKMSIAHTGKSRPPMTKEQKAKISATRIAKGIKHTEEWKAQQSKRFSGENNPNYGKHHSDETKLKQSQAASKRSSPIKGIPKSEEHKAKQSATMKRKYQERIQSL